jgi:N-ethylmaleimide reductase
MPSPFDPVTVGGLVLPHRIAMSPMTRNRAPGQIPNDLMARYYSQRASAGLIITEGTQPSVVGQGYLNTPGIHSAEQIHGWRKVTDAVHERGGRIFVQLMHSGRVGHASLLPDGMHHVAPSAVRADIQIFIGDRMGDAPVPTELTEDGITATIQDHAQAAANAIDAGFDGVELHGGNGYLIHQFLSTNANLRTDRWGGSQHNCARFAVETAKAVAERIGAHRVGLRISPGVTNNDIREDDPHDTYSALVDGLRPIGLPTCTSSRARTATSPSTCVKSSTAHSSSIPPPQAPSPAGSSWN